MELAIGTYFLFMMAYAVDTYNFFALPFLAIFVSRLLLGRMRQSVAGSARPSAVASAAQAGARTDCCNGRVARFDP